MNRRLKLAMALGSAALVAVPAVTALAQLPPDPPATFYGSVAGGTVGQGVVAIVLNGNASTSCGNGTVISDNGSTVYVVDVVSNAQITGCGVNGRNVRFYFTPTGSSGGKLANQTGTWKGAGPDKLDLTLGTELTKRGTIPMVASDRTLF